MVNNTILEYHGTPPEDIVTGYELKLVIRGKKHGTGEEADLGSVPLTPDSIRLYVQDTQERRKLFALFYEIPIGGVNDVILDPSERLIFYSDEYQSKPVHQRDLEYILPFINNPEINEMVELLTTTS